MTTTETNTPTNTATNAAKIDTAETHPVGKKMTMAEAINAALRDAMAADERVLVFGEDVGRLGGVFRVTDGLTETFG
ncbi:MAG: 2-oxoisovalerate dehydrogenase component beta subunit, partial [Pseudonocardiales bacterium]|nr:2-oxoisovalerate dehydrogenase component beta subunit [Pseudonocardiales bacterium]